MRFGFLTKLKRGLPAPNVVITFYGIDILGNHRDIITVAITRSQTSKRRISCLCYKIEIFFNKILYHLCRGKTPFILL